ncbi:MAG: hypothetical protein KA135_01510 [Halioglobus sp.]|nr:hypothetical protein [Halioglobus sp.]
MKTQKQQLTGLIFLLALAGPALALEEVLPMQAVNEALQTRIDQQIGDSLEREFYNRSASRQASPRDAATATNDPADDPAQADCPVLPIAPPIHQYPSAR